MELAMELCKLFVMELGGKPPEGPRHSLDWVGGLSRTESVRYSWITRGMCIVSAKRIRPCRANCSAPVEIQMQGNNLTIRLLCAGLGDFSHVDRHLSVINMEGEGLPDFDLRDADLGVHHDHTDGCAYEDEIGFQLRDGP